jgi:hypothetical protein
VEKEEREHEKRQNELRRQSAAAINGETALRAMTLEEECLSRSQSSVGK